MMTAAEEAFRRYCAPSLVAEYDAMNKEDQKATLLEALVSGSKSHLVQMIMSEKANQIGGSKDDTTKSSSGRKQARISCPLKRAMVEQGANPNAIKEHHLEYCHNVLAGWGILEQHPAPQLMRYKQIVAHQKTSEAYNKSKNSIGRQTNDAVVKTMAGSRSSPNFSDLRKISIRDLNLFAVSEGCYLEGKIIGECIQPMVGGTTMIEDNKGDIMLVCFYNYLPDGISGAEAEPMLRQKLPQGATLKIAEPFCKIFGDGQRGIRVDNPAEMLVVRRLGNAQGSKEDSCSRAMAAKKEGNAFVAQKRYYAATEAYLTGIRCNELVPAVLSNRCQALICLERYEEALCDAAASLTVSATTAMNDCSNNRLTQKTWARYDLCLEKLLLADATIQGVEKATTDPQAEGSLRHIFGCILNVVSPPLTNRKTNNKPDHDLVRGNALKVSGNEAFQKKDYETAIFHYSDALAAAGDVVRAMLSNWSLCALETMALGDVIAASIASLRISVEEKAVYRLSKALSFLGDYGLALRALNICPSSKQVQSLEVDIDQAKQIATKCFVQATKAGDCWSTLLENTPALLGNWCGPIETFVSRGKGRGLRACRDLHEGEVICCERPPISSVVSLKYDRDPIISNLGKDGIVHDASQHKLKSLLMLRLQRDGVLSEIMDQLSDGKQDNPLVPLSDLMLSLDMFPLLLPSHRQYLKGKKIPTLSNETVGNILRINAHGATEEDRITGNTNLFPAISMMNHASMPTCSFVPTPNSDAAVVVAIRPVKRGEELTMKYHTDEVVKQKWGISV